MSDEVDAAMDAVKAAMCDAMRDRAAPEPGGLELRPGDHSVLARGQASDRAVATSRSMHS